MLDARLVGATLSVGTCSTITNILRKKLEELRPEHECEIVKFKVEEVAE